jgi:hypothetical protein
VGVALYPVDGVRRDKGLGLHPEVSLKDARSKASVDRSLIAKGVDPIEERRASRTAEAGADVRRERAAKSRTLVIRILSGFFGSC